jgi:hypothetical protein
MRLERLTKAELIDEVRRLRGETLPTFEERYGMVEINRKPAPDKVIIAGMNLLKDELLVVDESVNLAFVHPKVKTVPNKIRIHGYAVRAFKKGQRVKMRHWFDYDPA